MLFQMLSGLNGTANIFIRIVSCYCFQNNFGLVLKVLSLLDADYSYDIHMKFVV